MATTFPPSKTLNSNTLIHYIQHKHCLNEVSIKSFYKSLLNILRVNPLLDLTICYYIVKWRMQSGYSYSIDAKQDIPYQYVGRQLLILNTLAMASKITPYVPCFRTQTPE